jgi:hypothetical protein
MEANDRYHVNKPDVILENFDDEIVIVNLASGNYYSVDAIGAEIWTMLHNGATAAEIAVQLSREYEAAASIIEQAVTEFIREALSEKLIVSDANAGARIYPLNTPAPNVRKPFASPALHKYTDMQELLLVDPIHEVDETGWPNIAGPVTGPASESNE